MTRKSHTYASMFLIIPPFISVYRIAIFIILPSTHRSSFTIDRLLLSIFQTYETEDSLLFRWEKFQIRINNNNNNNNFFFLRSRGSQEKIPFTFQSVVRSLVVQGEQRVIGEKIAAEITLALHASPCPTKIIASVEIRVAFKGRTFDVERSIRSVIATQHTWEGLLDEEEERIVVSARRLATDSSSADLRLVEEWWRNRAITLRWFNDRLSIGKSFPLLCLQNFFERSVVAFAHQRQAFQEFDVEGESRRLRACVWHLIGVPWFGSAGRRNRCEWRKGWRPFFFLKFQNLLGIDKCRFLEVTFSRSKILLETFFHL